MKKPAAPPRPREKKIPDEVEMQKAGAKARYGEDGDDPMMWDLISARKHLSGCRKSAPGKALIAALIDASERHDRKSVEWKSRWGFLEAVSQAVLEGDGEFFREVARLVEARLEGPPERRVDLEVAQAFALLRARSARRKEALPTKKQVREAALFSMAFSHAMRRRAGRLAWSSLHFYLDENGRAQLPAKFLKEIQKEVERLPEQNWTVIFKRCGLADLPNDKGGQRSHRQQRYSR
jgi:hypothetical protein